MKNFLALTSFTAVISIVPLAFAHEGMHGPGADLDLDGSGSLSLKEFRSSELASGMDEVQSAELFASLDEDANQLLSSTEYLRGLEPEAE